MRVFVTVGATSHFDLLVQTVISDGVLEALVKKGFKHLVIQSGPSKRFPESHEERDGLHIDFWNLKPSLTEDFQASDLIISHAGHFGAVRLLDQLFKHYDEQVLGRSSTHSDSTRP